MSPGIKPGEFLMGSDTGQLNDLPQEGATIDYEFSIGQVEVTQEQYNAVTGANPSRFKGDRLPVETVSWADAAEFSRDVERASRRLRILASDGGRVGGLSPPEGDFVRLYYRRVKTQKQFHRPMNRVVHAHLKSIMPEMPQADAPVFDGGSSRPNKQFQALCELAGVKPKQDVETGEEKPWVLKDLRKTAATYYDEHMPESSIEILGHSVAGVTYRDYAHRDPLTRTSIDAQSWLAAAHAGNCLRSKAIDPFGHRRFGATYRTVDSAIVYNTSMAYLAIK